MGALWCPVDFDYCFVLFVENATSLLLSAAISYLLSLIIKNGTAPTDANAIPSMLILERFSPNCNHPNTHKKGRRRELMIE